MKQGLFQLKEGDRNDLQMEKHPCAGCTAATNSSRWKSRARDGVR